VPDGDKRAHLWVLSSFAEGKLGYSWVTPGGHRPCAAGGRLRVVWPRREGRRRRRQCRHKLRRGRSGAAAQI